jgi:hypothetical protein
MLRDMSHGHRAYADAMFQAYRGQPVAGEITPEYSLLSARDYADMAALATGRAVLLHHARPL